MALADPRRYGSGAASDALLSLRGPALEHALRELALAGRDAEILATLEAAPNRDVYAQVWHALCAAVEKPVPGEGVAARVFALPWVIVCGASEAATLDGVIADVASLTGVLEANGVFGASRSLGLGNALVSMEALEALRPSALLEWSRAPGTRDVAPAPIVLTRGEEAVHVRFLLGAAIAPPHLPDIVETGANIGQWGTAALRAMAAQLATPGAQVLPLPRPPAGVYTAAFAGRRAGVEAAFNLFMSNAVRRFRQVTGDPAVTLSSHHGAELRVTLTTSLDDSLVEGFRWPLHPADDIDRVESTVVAMVEECRLAEPQCIPGVLPDLTSTGALFFPNA
jgi:hypothetical protein